MLNRTRYNADFISFQLGFLIKVTLTVNQRVLGSSPSWGASLTPRRNAGRF